MPKGIPNVKKEEEPNVPSPTDEILSKLSEMLSPITEKLSEMEKRMEKTENKFVEMEKPREIKMNIVETPNISAPTTSTVDSNPYAVPCPQAYIDLKNEILNEEFGISMSMAEGGVAISIIVPEKYTNLNKSEYAYRKADVRTSIITNAKGEIGLREWLEKVRNNLRETFKK